jgi:hypothetical protein
MKGLSRPPDRPGRYALSIAIIALAGISACSGGSSTAVSGSGAAAGKPVCTSAAIEEAARKHVEKSGGVLKDVEFFECSEGFAFALADERDGQTINAIPILFKASHKTWAAVDRGIYCPSGSVPKKLLVQACEAS